MSEWKTKRIGEFLTLEYGKPLDKSLRKEKGKYPAYGANGIKCRTDEYFYDRKTLIIGRKGSAGEVTLSEDKFWPLDVTYFVKFDEELYDLNFIWFLLKTLNLPSLASGVKPGINRNKVYSIEVKVPEIEEQKRIVAILEFLFADIETLRINAESKLHELESLKNSLLHKAFTGELTKSKGVAT